MMASQGEGSLVALDNVTLLPSDQILAYDSRYTAGGDVSESGSDAFQLLYTAVNRVTLPTLGVLGMLGNLANIIIFARRYTKRTVNATERGAVLGFVALAASDLCFCLGLVPRYWLPSAPSVLYDSRTDFALLYQMYGLYVHDLFIKISTWLATVISVSRYTNVARSLQVPTKGGVVRLKAAIVAVYFIWPLLCLPRLWTYDVTELVRSGGAGTNDTGVVEGEPVVVYFLHLGAFKLNKRIKLIFTYLWVLLGYFLPVAILVYCNVCLVVVLRRNRAFWEQDSGIHSAGSEKRVSQTQQWRVSRSGSLGQHHYLLHHHPHHPSHPPPPPPPPPPYQQQRTKGGRLSLARVSRRSSAGVGGGKMTHRYWGLSVSALLVVLVSMFLVLVSPSELLHFYDDLVQPATFRAYEAAILATNVLQAINFAVHFVLYCVFSRPYRRALWRCALAVRNRISRAQRHLASSCCSNEQPHYELQMPLTVTPAWRPSHQGHGAHQQLQSRYHRPAVAAAAATTKTVAGGTPNRQPLPATLQYCAYDTQVRFGAIN